MNISTRHLLKATARIFCPQMGAAFVPGRLAIGFMRAVEAVMSPVVMAGPELDKRLRPHAERLCDIASPTRAERLQRAAILWLIGAPEASPDTTDAEPRRSTGARACDLAALALLRARQAPPSAGQASLAEGPPIASQEAPSGSAVPLHGAAEGVLK